MSPPRRQTNWFFGIEQFYVLIFQHFLEDSKEICFGTQKLCLLKQIHPSIDRSNSAKLSTRKKHFEKPKIGKEGEGLTLKIEISVEIDSMLALILLRRRRQVSASKCSHNGFQFKA